MLKASVRSSLKPLGSPKYNPLTNYLIITISKLFINSLFIDDELSNSEKEIIGRILINKFNRFLNSNNPDSGFFSFANHRIFYPLQLLIK